MVDPISWLFGGGSHQEPAQVYQEPAQVYQEPEKKQPGMFDWFFGTQEEEPAQSQYQEVADSEGLNIQGDPEFVQQITRAYNQLDADDREFVRSRTTRIEQHHRVSGAFPVHKVIMLGGEVLERTDQSIAGVIRHEAGHMDSGGAANSQQEELKCIADQIRTLEKIGGCPQEIAYLRSQDGNHYLDQ